MVINLRIRHITVAAGLALAGAVAVAPAQAAPQETRAGANVQGQNQAAPERKICAREEMPNTRLSRRVCRTVAEWERLGGVPTN